MSFWQAIYSYIAVRYVNPENAISFFCSNNWCLKVCPGTRGPFPHCLFIIRKVFITPLKLCEFWMFCLLYIFNQSQMDFLISPKVKNHLLKHSVLISVGDPIICFAEKTEILYVNSFRFPSKQNQNPTPIATIFRILTLYQNYWIDWTILWEFCSPWLDKKRETWRGKQTPVIIIWSW